MPKLWATNERTSGNGAMMLLFHINRPWRAVPECERYTALNVIGIIETILCS